MSSGIRHLLLRALVGSSLVRCAGVVLTFGVGILLARALGPHGYGLYGMAMSLAALLAVPAHAGFSLLATREIALAVARDDHATASLFARRALAATAGVSVGLSLLLTTVATLTTATFDPLLVGALFGVGVFLPFLALGETVAAALRGAGSPVAGQLPEALIRPLLVLLGLLGAFRLLDGALTPAAAMLCNAAAAAGAAAFAGWQLHRVLPSPTAAHVEPPRLAWRAALPLAAGEGLRVLSGHMGILALSAVAAPAAVGWYRAAFAVYTITVLPATLLGLVVAPHVASLHAGARHDTLARVNGAVAVLLTGGALAALLAAAFSGTAIIETLFGETFAPATTVLVVLLAGEMVCATLGLPTVVLNMLGDEGTVLRWYAWTTAVGLLGTVLGALAWGGVGAALALMASQVLLRAGTAWQAWRRHGTHTSLLACAAYRRSTSAERA